MKDIPAGKALVDVKSVSWQDMDLLRPMQTIRFDDFNSWELIAEWCIENRDFVKQAFMSWQWGSNLFFYVDHRGKKEWHEPMPYRGDYAPTNRVSLTIEDVIAMGKEEMDDARNMLHRTR